MHFRIRFLTLSAFFMALGVVFPIVFHALGVGSLFLPMFWPIVLGGFFLPILHAMIVGGITPLLSFELTGMPPMMILPVMIPELMSLAFIVSILKRNMQLGSFWIVLFGLLGSRVVLFLLGGILGKFIGLSGSMVSLAVLIKSLPGSIAMLLFLPVFLSRVTGRPIFGRRTCRL